MPGMQDIYSVNVSNRYDIGGEDVDAVEDYDPLDTLQSLEDEKKRASEEAKKKKQSIANKSRNQKKPVRFQENKDANIPPKKEANNNAPKSTKPPRQQNDRNDGPPRANNRRPPRDRQNYGEGDENRRPPRRRNDRNEPRNDVANAKGEGVNQSNQSKGDQSFGRPSGNDYAPRRDRAERYRGSRGGYGNGRGGQGRSFGGHRNDGRDDRGKREFDRRSGSDRSGVKPTDKRDGAGPRNWGTPGNEIEDAGDVTEPVGTWQEPGTETTEQESTEKVEKTEEEAATTEEQEPKPEEPAEMTLDEWKAKQESHNKPAFNIRKAGEGEDMEKWKNLKVLRKINSRSESKPEMASDEQQKRQVKQQVSVNIQFGDNAARGFGGRGRGRGDRGRGRGRGGGRYGGDRNQRQQYMPDVQNEQEFPTLG